MATAPRSPAKPPTRSWPNDNLDTVVAAVEEGRRVYANIHRFLVHGLSGGATEIAFMQLGPLLGLALTLLPAQILWVNLLTHGLPGVALGGEPAKAAAMSRPPRPPDQGILGAGLWQRVIRISIVLTAVTLGIAVWACTPDAPGRAWPSSPSAPSSSAPVPALAPWPTRRCCSPLPERCFCARRPVSAAATHAHPRGHSPG